MAILRKKKDKNKKIEIEKVEIKENEEIKEEKKMLVDDSTTNGEKTKVEEIKTTGEEEIKPRKVSLKKGSKVIVNGRCLGASSLECPLKTVRNHETKILDVDKDNNSILIDEGWISIDNLVK